MRKNTYTRESAATNDEVFALYDYDKKKRVARFKLGRQLFISQLSYRMAVNNFKWQLCQENLATYTATKDCDYKVTYSFLGIVYASFARPKPDQGDLIDRCQEIAEGMGGTIKEWSIYPYTTDLAFTRAVFSAYRDSIDYQLALYQCFMGGTVDKNGQDIDKKMIGKNCAELTAARLNPIQ